VKQSPLNQKRESQSHHKINNKSKQTSSLSDSSTESQPAINTAGFKYRVYSMHQQQQSLIRVISHDNAQSTKIERPAPLSLHLKLH